MWDTILNVITHPVSVTVLTAIAGVAIKGFVKYKKFYTEVNDIARAVLKSRNEKSPGGKKITSEEYTIIGKEVVEAIEAGAIAFKK